VTARASLRSRVLFGAALWTLGLLAASIVALTFHVTARVALSKMHGHTAATMIVAGAFLVAGFAVVAGSIRSIADLRRKLSDVRAGRDDSLHGDYPAEVQPLVDDLNGLISHNQQAVARANAKAGDLAHGLKTPLAVLSHEAERARREGQDDLAATIQQQVERMRRQIDYHLAQARAAASGATPGARSEVRESAEALSRTLQRLHADRPLEIDLAVPPGLAVRVQREDLDEMLGNLLDNACKWSRTHVRLEAVQRADGLVAVLVDDDGPGLEVSMRERVLQRGVRADEAAPGSGLGLAIVRDLADLYGGAITLGASPLRGLRAELTLPGC